MSADEAQSARRLRLVAWTVGISIAVIQAWYYRQWINGDAISYFDMSDAVVRQEWSRLVNTTWSPLYPALIGVLVALIRPGPALEFPVAHLANFLCFLFAFASFEFLLRSLPWDRADGTRRPLTRLSLLGIAYGLFLWSALGMLSVMKPTPDMLMSGFLFLGVGLVMRIRNGAGRWHTYAVLGIVLGFGYLSKAIMFPLGVIMLGLTLFAPGGFTRKLARTALAGVSFLVVALPYASAVSKLAHRPTFGEAGTVVHLIYVDRVLGYWQGPGQGTGAFIHPVTKLVDGPAPVFAFPRPITATYPYWYDPYYWTEGVRPAFHLRHQIGVFVSNLRIYAVMLARMAGVLVVLMILAWAAGLRGSLRALLPCYPMLLVSLAALGAYATLHLEDRYVGAFFVLLWLGLFAGIRIPVGFPVRTSRILAAVVVLNVAGYTAYQVDRDLNENEVKTQHDYVAASRGLSRLGLHPGDPVAAISPWVARGWARLSRLQIIAEVQRSHSDEYWKQPAEYQERVLAAFAQAGCKVAVAWIGYGATPAGWERLEDSPYAVHALALR